MRSFGELLTEYMRRTGISDSELARSIGVQRQTIFRWKEGSVARPRVREDVLRCAERLRLTPAERDLLLLAAGFAPETPASVPPQPGASALGETTLTFDSSEQFDSAIKQTSENDTSQPRLGWPAAGEDNVGTLDELVAPLISATSVVPHRSNRRQPVILLLAFLALAVIGASSWRTLRGLIDPNLRATPISTLATPAVTATPAPTPISTPAIRPAASKEMLILIATFANLTSNSEVNFDMAGRLKDALSDAFKDSEVPNVRIELLKTDPLADESAALQWRKTISATMVFWGEYDSGRVVIRLLGSPANITQRVETGVDSASNLSAAINKFAPKEIKAYAYLTAGYLHLRHQPPNSTLARKAIDKALALDPQTTETRAAVYFYLGYFSEQDAKAKGTPDQWQQAIDYYSQALALKDDKDWYFVVYNRGNAYSGRSKLAAKASPALKADLAAALADYNQALQYKPTFGNAYWNRGETFYNRNEAGDVDAARTDLERALKLTTSPTDRAEQLFMLGLIKLRQDSASDWDANFRQALSLNPKDTAAYAGLCWGYAVSAQAEKAVIECETLRAKASNFAQNADGYAIALAQLGRLAEADEILQSHLVWLKSQPSQLYERNNGPLVEAWLVDLQAKQNPFDAATLEQLRLGQ